MHIARFEDTSGRIHYGVPLDNGHATPLVGDLYAGLTETGASAEVAKWLAPIAPVNIFCMMETQMS